AGTIPPLSQPALDAFIGATSQVAVDDQGRVHFTGANCVFRLDSPDSVTRIAGVGITGYTGDGGLATNAPLNSPGGVAVDRSGNVYIADTVNDRIRRVSPDGNIVTVAGTGVRGFLGDGGKATEARLSRPMGIAVDKWDNLYIADYDNCRIRKVSSG